MNLGYEDWVQVQMYLIQKREQEDILGDVEPCDINGW